MNPQRFPHLFWKVPRFTIPGLSQTRIKSRFSVSLLDGRIIFGKKTHVGAKSALLRRLFLPTAQKAAGCVAPLLLLPAKSHAAPPLFACKRAHNTPACYQLFAEKGKGTFSQRLAVSVQNPGRRSPEGFSCPAGHPLLPGVDRAPARATLDLPT